MNILMVDDDIDSRNSIARFLRRLGHQVVERGEGKAATALLEKGTFHLVLSDIRMPGMDGHQLLRHIKKSPKLKDIVVVLITGYGEIRGAVAAIQEGAYDYLLKPVHIDELGVLVDKITEYISLKLEHRALTEHFDKEVEAAAGEIKKELEDVKKAYAREVGTLEIGIFSSKLREVFTTSKKLHRNPDLPVLIEGETGTGKELVARFIHYGESGVTSPFVDINCAAISPALFESELFGYEAGAFTGGNPKGQKGKIELAQGGSILLDEITELSIDFQAKLLRVIQEKEYYRVGGLKKMKADVRFICCTNKVLAEKVANGTFREDLFYRLNVGYLHVPPLRERREEIIPLTNMFMKQLSEKKNSRFATVSPEARTMLQGYFWPGNVRELKSAVERIALLWDDSEIKPEHLTFLTAPNHAYLPPKKPLHAALSPGDVTLPYTGFELNTWILDLVSKALDKHHGNKTETAKYLGISRNVLYTYLKNLKKQ